VSRSARWPGARDGFAEGLSASGSNDRPGGPGHIKPIAIGGKPVRQYTPDGWGGASTGTDRTVGFGARRKGKTSRSCTGPRRTSTNGVTADGRPCRRVSWDARPYGRGRCGSGRSYPGGRVVLRGITAMSIRWRIARTDNGIASGSRNHPCAGDAVTMEERRDPAHPGCVHSMAFRPGPSRGSFFFFSRPFRKISLRIWDVATDQLSDSSSRVGTFFFREFAGARTGHIALKESAESDRHGTDGTVLHSFRTGQRRLSGSRLAYRPAGRSGGFGLKKTSRLISGQRRRTKAMARRQVIRAGRTPWPSAATARLAFHRPRSHRPHLGCGRGECVAVC